MKVEAAGLSRVFHVGASDIVAVNRINFEIAPGEFVAVVGPSGSGKSTLLNLLGLNDYPTFGTVLIDDIDASLLSNTARRRIRLTRMGFVFQTFNLLPTLSALENVELPMALAGVSAKAQRKRAIQLLESVGLGHRLAHRPKELSIGEMQRVAIARAVSNTPEVIYADEPTGELDSATAEDVARLLHDLNRRHKTAVVVATHDMRIAETADKVFEIQDGALTV